LKELWSWNPFSNRDRARLKNNEHKGRNVPARRQNGQKNDEEFKEKRKETHLPAGHTGGEVKVSSKGIKWKKEKKKGVQGVKL